MLPKPLRITSSRDYKRVYQKGSFFSMPLFNINYIANKSAVSRIGIIAGKKVALKATARNLVKRRTKEAFAALYPKLAKGYDIVVTLKGSALGKSFSEIEAAASEVTRRIGHEKIADKRN